MNGRLFAFELRVPGYTYDEHCPGHCDFSSAVELIIHDCELARAYYAE